jgi:hypothetical protein
MGSLGLAWDIQGVPDRIYREAREGTASPVDDEANAEASV